MLGFALLDPTYKFTLPFTPSQILVRVGFRLDRPNLQIHYSLFTIHYPLPCPIELQLLVLVRGEVR